MSDGARPLAFPPMEAMIEQAGRSCFWTDADEILHVDLAVLLRASGYAESGANQAALFDVLETWLKAKNPGVEVIEVNHFVLAPSKGAPPS